MGCPGKLCRSLHSHVGESTVTSPSGMLQMHLIQGDIPFSILLY